MKRDYHTLREIINNYNQLTCLDLVQVVQVNRVLWVNLFVIISRSKGKYVGFMCMMDLGATLCAMSNEVFYHFYGSWRLYPVCFLNTEGKIEQ